MTDKTFNYFMGLRSAVKAIEEFEDRFTMCYDKLPKNQQQIVLDNVEHIFRKWYYSALIQDTFISPANIINSLVERKFKSQLMFLPQIAPSFKGKKLAGFHSSIFKVSVNNHPVVNDLVHILDIFTPDAELDEDMALSRNEKKKLGEDFLRKTDHYIDYLTTIAWKLGLVKKLPSIGGNRGQVSKEAPAFLSLDNGEKLDKIIDAAISLCSTVLSDAFPFQWKPFSIRNIELYLKKPGDTSRIFTQAYGSMIEDIEHINKKIENGLEPETEEEEMLIAMQYAVGSMLDSYFFTPFGYYLQLIQPLYTFAYDMDFEIEELLYGFENPETLEFVQFSPPVSYDLTPIGEDILLKGKKSERKQEGISNLDDNELYDIIEISKTSNVLEEPEEECLSELEIFKKSRKLKSSKKARKAVK